MQILKLIFSPIMAIFKFINNYFKACLFLLILFFVFAPNGDIKQPNLAEISINGAILDANEVIKQLEEVRIDQNIKGVPLNIDSPGGALSPSVEIAMQVKKLKESKKVVAYAAGTMTSGSYYSAINADKIVANPGAFIGSIGVIIQVPNISELGKKLGISEQVVKAGEYKEAGTFTREWSEVERASLQDLTDKSYALFTNDVATARNLDLNKKDQWANARVFLASDALNLGLIDMIGGYFDAKNELIKLSEVNEPIWQETPQIEKFIKRLTEQSVGALLNLFIKF